MNPETDDKVAVELWKMPENVFPKADPGEVYRIVEIRRSGDCLPSGIYAEVDTEKYFSTFEEAKCECLVRGLTFSKAPFFVRTVLDVVRLGFRHGLLGMILCRLDGSVSKSWRLAE